MEHLEIRDRDGCLLTYRFRVPNTLVKSLVDSDKHLPELNTHHQRKIDPRGEFPIRHYATWADSRLDIYYCKDYLTQQPASITWIEKNQPLWGYLRDHLKLIFPKPYNKLTNIILPPSLQLLCNPWAGVAINQPMTPYSALQAHQDWKDMRSVPNAVVPYGDYDSGDLVLCQAKYIVELRPGDSILFMGSLICHVNTKITRGVRNSVNLFTHKSNID